jgi:hypothetical protein
VTDQPEGLLPIGALLVTEPDRQGRRAERALTRRARERKWTGGERDRRRGGVWSGGSTDPRWWHAPSGHDAPRLIVEACVSSE